MRLTADDQHLSWALVDLARGLLAVECPHSTWQPAQMADLITDALQPALESCGMQAVSAPPTSVTNAWHLVERLESLGDPMDDITFHLLTAARPAASAARQHSLHLMRRLRLEGLLQTFCTSLQAVGLDRLPAVISRLFMLLSRHKYVQRFVFRSGRIVESGKDITLWCQVPEAWLTAFHQAAPETEIESPLMDWLKSLSDTLTEAPHGIVAQQ